MTHLDLVATLKLILAFAIVGAVILPAWKCDTRTCAGPVGKLARITGFRRQELMPLFFGGFSAFFTQRRAGFLGEMRNSPFSFRCFGGFLDVASRGSSLFR